MRRFSRCRFLAGEVSAVTRFYANALFRVTVAQGHEGAVATQFGAIG
jgi:hypothetical protein